MAIEAMQVAYSSAEHDWAAAAAISSHPLVQPQQKRSQPPTPQQPNDGLWLQHWVAVALSTSPATRQAHSCDISFFLRRGDLLGET